MAVELGINTKLGFVTSNSGAPPADPTFIIEYERSDIRLVETKIQTTGIRGRVDMAGHRELVQSRFVTGGFNSQPTPAELRNLLPWINGTAEAGSGTAGAPYLYALSETLPFLDAIMHKAGVGWKYRECVASRATFSSSQGQPLALAVEVAGKARDTIGAYSWPALAIDLDDIPWMMHQCILTVGGTPYQFREFSLTIDNRPVMDRFLNTTNPTDFPRSEREITLTVNQPVLTSSALLATLTAGDVAGSIVFTKSTTHVLTFSFVYLVPPSIDDPIVAGRGEIDFPYSLAARSDSTGGGTTWVSPMITSLQLTA